MGVTGGEKEHFKTRLNERVTELTDEIINEDCNWQRKLVKQAVENIEKHYGITERLQELRQWRRRAHQASRKAQELTTAICAEMRGLKPEHIYVASAPYSYGHSPYTPQRVGTPIIPLVFADNDFHNYPADIRGILRAHAEAEFRRMAEEHTVGKRLAALRDKAADFQDRLVAAGTHAQLQQIWKEAGEEFKIIVTDNRERRMRRIAVHDSDKVTK